MIGMRRDLISGHSTPLPTVHKGNPLWQVGHGSLATVNPLAARTPSPLGWWESLVDRASMFIKHCLMLW